ncbi:MAG TPA: GNAT family N-acetyltransferase [Dyella sp.]|uniref:GNAT family N-acetyltransferase n=1 Tax=Dyella sp. TaxID=1869338 RepID=UPI002D79BAAC|nr:GNAT family N-acetyltransferase [Dyella sp.]HET6553076.1 GNAT family N-acetyltransferase [Dyella sp.]
MSASTHPFAEIAKPFLPFLDALEGDHWIEPLRDGTPVLIRPLAAEDREREVAFINGLSHTARRMRFLGDFQQVGAATVDRLMDVDCQNHMAFVALVHEDGKLREIGVSRYSATGDGKHCECAVTVADEWQGKGLGVLLMRHLMDVARRKGFRHMFSVDGANNQAMRDLASYLGFVRRPDPHDSTLVIHSIDLV